MKPLPRSMLVIASVILAGCDTIGEALEPPRMEKPIGIPETVPPQDTPELEARAAREREALPRLPPTPDSETYSYLGSVPPKPVLPTPEEITGQIKGLAAEEAKGQAVIDAQADNNDPETLPRPAPTVKHATVATTTVAAPMSANQNQVFSGNSNAFLPQSQVEQTDRLPADAP